MRFPMKGEEVDMPTEFGHFRLIPFRQKSNGLEHVALIKGEWNEDEPILVRVHSSCMTGDIFGSQRCDCGSQLHEAMKLIDETGKVLDTTTIYPTAPQNDEDGALKLVIADENSDIEQNYIDKEINTILLSKVKDILTNEQFSILKLFINGASYGEIANVTNLTTKKVDNTLQAIKKKLKTIKGEV